MCGGCRIPFAFCLLPGLPLFLCGCFNRSFVEPDYRFRDDHVAELREHLYTGEFHASARHREEAHKPDEPHVTVYRQPTPSVTKQRLVLTASPVGERKEALQVIVELRDQGGRSLRVPASLHLNIRQAGPDTQAASLGDWDLPQDLLEHAWTANWSGAGYRLILPWKASFDAEQVRVVARLTLGDGTLYDAEQEVVLNAIAGEKGLDRGKAVAPTVQQVRGHANESEALQAPPVSTHWESPSLEGALKLGRPVPLGDDD